LYVGDPALSFVRSGSVPRYAIDAAGVGHNLVAVGSAAAPWRPGCASPLKSLACSVGHSRPRLVASVSVTCEPFEPEPIESIPVGVGHQPEPFSSMGGTDFGRTETTPFRIEPHFGKVGEDVVEPSFRDDLGDVLKEDTSRSNLFDDPLEMGPQVSFVFDAVASAG